MEPQHFGLMTMGMSLSTMAMQYFLYDQLLEAWGVFYFGAVTCILMAVHQVSPLSFPSHCLLCPLASLPSFSPAQFVIAILGLFIFEMWTVWILLAVAMVACQTRGNPLRRRAYSADEMGGLAPALVCAV